MKYFVLNIFICCVATSLFAQQRLENKANSDYEKYAYVDAIATYERIANQGYKNSTLLKNLANSYYFNAKLVDAAKWYEELFQLGEEMEIEYYFRYAQSLKAIGNYKKADEMMELFFSKNKSDSRGILASAQKDYLEQIEKNSGRYEIQEAGINSIYSDYGSAFYENKIVFTSARDTGNFTKRKHSWTGSNFTRLYASEKNADGSLTKPEKFANELQTRFHESTPVFSNDGKTIYFTRNNFNNGKKGKDSDKRTLLKIYRSTKSDKGNWSVPEELPFNSDEYQCAHPALSPDNKWLIFASDMPGTLGKSDLFKVAINNDGTFGTPQNLGPKINTEGRESFPFVSKSNELFFASDGHPGLGGLDIFRVLWDDTSNISEILNIGKPANSSFDDFGYIIDSDSKLGFLSSNREKGIGDDDIYRFKELKPLQKPCEQILNGLVTDAESGQVITSAKVTLFDQNFSKLDETVSDNQGKFKFNTVSCDAKYYVRAEKTDYNTNEKAVQIPKTTGETFLPIELEKTQKPITVGDDIAKIFGIKVIYFDLDKSNIRPDAALELAKILDVLKQYPTLKIDIRSHTDSRQTHKYNEALSDRRAKSTREWLIQNGIDKNRLTAKGYGETQLVNQCSDNVECTEEEHQRNRRSEFIVTEL
jgi:outer membrane protein OmpA-like peptidoglycan-associated protein